MLGHLSGYKAGYKYIYHGLGSTMNLQVHPLPVEQKKHWGLIPERLKNTHVPGEVLS